MKKLIQKLVKEQKIIKTEPSKNIFLSYNKKAENSLKAAKILLKQELMEESITMSYYSMYHKATALLRLTGIKCENHNATIHILKEIFCLDINSISIAKTERTETQYYTNSKIKKSDVINSITKAEYFIQEIDLFTDSLNEDKRREYLKKFKEQYKVL